MALQRWRARAPLKREKNYINSQVNRPTTSAANYPNTEIPSEGQNFQAGISALKKKKSKTKMCG